MTPEELRLLSEDEFAVVKMHVDVEFERRRVLAEAAEKTETIAKSVYEAKGGDDREYEQPAGAHDAYPFGAIVTLDGKRYKSLIQGNVWSPATFPRGWVEVDEDGVEPPRTAAAWKQPTGAHDAYRLGDLVIFEGETYESLLHANVWSPAVLPSGWSQHVEPEEPEEPPVEEPTIPAWKQPTGAHDAYKIGDRVLFEGKTYESLIGGNVWSPSANPAGWKMIN